MCALLACRDCDAALRLWEELKDGDQTDDPSQENTGKTWQVAMEADGVSSDNLTYQTPEEAMEAGIPLEEVKVT